MDIFEITGLQTGVSRAGVNYLQPMDSYQNVVNGFIYRQVLQSRRGIDLFTPRLEDKSRIFGIFEHVLPDGVKELLAIDKNFLYKYSDISNTFVKIPFGGSLLDPPTPYTGFNITSKDQYVSGTSYPIAPLLSGGAVNPKYANPGSRFVFTSPGFTPFGTSRIFFYNGTTVQDFTNVADNPNYAPPLNPVTNAAGTLNAATYVIRFGERLNFIRPIINSVEYAQGVLYSAIRTSSGNGDKFNIAGSGLLQADTFEDISGCTELGQVLALNFDRSNWTLEKTQDAFNPYFIRKIPSVLGTDAKFSAVCWNYSTKSLGRTGIISTDGRQSLRSDDKIPYFTTDEIDQVDFNLTYGGFDRVNGQFLWAYKESETETDTQNRVLVNNYEESTFSVFEQRFSVFGQTDLGQNLAWDDIEASEENPSWGQWDTTEEIWDRIGLGQSVQKTLAGDDMGFIYDINQDFDDYFASISSITQSTNAVLTVSESAFKPGDFVVIQNVEGMTQLNNFNPDLHIGDPGYEASIKNFTPYEVKTATDTTITLYENTSPYDPATPNTGTVSKVINFSAETIPFNPYRSDGMRCYVSHVEFLIDVVDSGYLKVDVYQDEEEAPYKQNILLIPTATQQSREWITMSVDNEANFHTFVMKQTSPAAQMRLTSMRIHCTQGGLTSG